MGHSFLLETERFPSHSLGHLLHALNHCDPCWLYPFLHADLSTPAAFLLFPEHLNIDSLAFPLVTCKVAGRALGPPLHWFTMHGVGSRKWPEREGKLEPVLLLFPCHCLKRAVGTGHRDREHLLDFRGKCSVSSPSLPFVTVSSLSQGY